LTNWSGLSRRGPITPDHRQDGALIGAQSFRRGLVHFRHHLQQRAFHVSAWHRRMNIIGAAGCNAVSQLRRGDFGGGDDILLCLGVGRAPAEIAQSDGAFHSSGPRAKIARRERLACGIPQVIVHITGRNATRSSGLIDVLKQMLAGQVVTLPHNPCQAPVCDLHLVLHSALAGEVEAERRALYLHVLVAKCGQAVGVVFGSRFFIADPHPRYVQQPYEGRQQFLPRHPRQRQILIHLRAGSRNRRRHLRHPFELRQTANLAIRRMIPVLSAPPRVITDGLEVTERIAANPDLRPRRRKNQRANARQRFRIPDRLAVIEIDESLPAFLTDNSGALMAAVAKACNGRGLLRIER